MVDDTQKLVRPISQGTAGKVVIDSRGRNVWQWQDTQLDSTSIVLKRLENDSLELEPTRRVRAVTKGGHGKPAPDAGGRSRRGKAGEADEADEAEIGIEQTLTVDAAGGFDPYNRS